MKSELKINQSTLWAGAIGESYMKRNPASEESVNIKVPFWKNILSTTKNVSSILEVGSNVGVNLRAIKKFHSDINLYAVEPNKTAIDILIKDNVLNLKNIFNSSAQSIDKPDKFFDLVFTSGVLIHIENSNLDKSIEEIYRVSKKYILCIEYFSDKEEFVYYDDGNAILVKRDYGALYLDKFKDLKVVDYGFLWKRIEKFDNVTWWLFEKA